MSAARIVLALCQQLGAKGFEFTDEPALAVRPGGLRSSLADGPGPRTLLAAIPSVIL